MSKRWQPTVQLLAAGSIIPELHYGPFLRIWWYIKTTKNNNTINQSFYPYHIGLKTRTEIKGQQIILRVVVGNTYNRQMPGICCESNGISGDVADNPTSA